MYEIAILGGSGYIGSSLAKYLSNSFRVKVLDTNPVPDSIRQTVQFEFCDITDSDDVNKGIEDVFLVINTAIVQIPYVNEVKRAGYGVNLLGIQNLCSAVDKHKSPKGLLLAGTWHVFGYGQFSGIIDESFAFKPDKVEDTARFYVLSKIAQETIMKLYNEMSSKFYGVIRMGTVLGEGMPENAAANIFISKGLLGEAITPYAHSMHRPMLYVDIVDVCRAFEAYAKKTLENVLDTKNDNVVNLVWPEPITILELANIVKDKIVECSQEKISPEIKVINTGLPVLYAAEDKKRILVDISKAEDLLSMKRLNAPSQTIERIIRARMN